MAYVVNFLRAYGIQKIYFNAVATPVSIPTDIWAATWLPTDDSIGFPMTLAAEDMGDVNTYTYVKPMISVLDCIGDGGYENSTVTQFINGTNCGVPNLRLNAIVNKLKDLPEGKRSYVLTRYNQGPFYDEVADRFSNGEQSPWAEFLGTTLDSDVTTLFTRIGASGATPDYAILDCEQYNFVFQYQPLSNHSGTTLDSLQVFGITSDTLYTQTWYGVTAFRDLYTNTITGQTFGFSNILSGTFHPQNTRDYLYWDRSVLALHDTVQNKFIVEPLQQIFPSVKVSNYDSFVLTDGGTLGNYYNQNGHPILKSTKVGDAASPVLYAGWGFPSVYGISDEDTTKIVRTDYSGTTAFGSNAWNHFLLLLQNMRATKRSNPNTPIRPWIASPYFVESANGFDAQWTDSTENLGLYYESIRHMALTDTELFLYFNSGSPVAESDATKMQTALTRLNSVLQEVNTIKGGYQSNKCTTTERIDFLADYVLTGAGTTRGTYLWRVTPKPGFVLQTNDRFPIETDNDGGAWLETETSTPPGLTLTLESQFAKLRNKDLTKRFYSYMFIANQTGVTDPANLVFDGWSYIAKATFMGKPDGTGSIPRTVRAYPFEYNPANPKTSSPWHNVIYERFFEDYFAGIRALSIHFPWSTAFSGISGMNSWMLQPLDMLYGTTGFTFMYPRAGLCGYINGYNSTTEPEWCQARVKGFTGAIKQLLEGTMSPSGRTGITQACDVMIYTPSLDGWANYRTQKHIWWDRCAGTSAERDTALNARIDQYINELIIPMKATTATGGILSISLDVGSYAATPDDIHLWRTMPDYRSDTCELASWYMRGKLEENGVYCYTEARGVTQWNKIDLGFSYPDGVPKRGATGATASTGMKAIVGDENYLWYSDPDLSFSKGEVYYKNRSYIRNINSPAFHRLTGSYLTIGSRLPWEISTETTYEGFTMEQYYANFSDPAGSHYLFSMVYSPYWSLSQIYGAADIYNDYLYRTATYGNAVWGERRAMKQFSTLAIDWFSFAGWPLINQGECAGGGGLGSTLGHDYRWWDPVAVPSVNTMPRFYGYGFTTSAASKTMFGYPTDTYTAGFWTDATVDWWRDNVRGKTFGTLLNIFKDLAMRANPTGAPDPPYWIDAPSPEPFPSYPVWGHTDTYWTHGIDSTIR